MPHAPRQYYLYILTNQRHTVLYIGVTNNLGRRLAEHRESQANTFTHRYQVHKLVYFEAFDRVEEAISREKQLKAGSRSRKIALVNTSNSTWVDLSEEW